jgi:putative copper export protein
MGIGAWDAAAVLIKAILYAATFGAAGGIYFVMYSPALSLLSSVRIQRVLGFLLIIGIGVSALRILVLAGSMSGEIAGMLDRSMTGMIVKGREGEATGVRLLGLLLAALALQKNRRYWSVALIGALLAATSFAWVGHAQTAAPKALAVFLITVHLIGVAFWLGALFPLLIVAQDPDTTRIAAAAARFGQIAFIVVVFLVIAGTGLLWMLLGNPSELWLSEYGRFVMLKLGLVAALLSLAAFNKWRLTGRLRVNDLRAAQTLRRSIRAEMALGALILLVTAAFTTLLGPPIME